MSANRARLTKPSTTVRDAAPRKTRADVSEHQAAVQADGEKRCVGFVLHLVRARSKLRSKASIFSGQQADADSGSGAPGGLRVDDPESKSRRSTRSSRSISRFRSPGLGRLAASRNAFRQRGNPAMVVAPRHPARHAAPCRRTSPHRVSSKIIADAKARAQALMVSDWPPVCADSSLSAAHDQLCRNERMRPDTHHRDRRSRSSFCTQQRVKSIITPAAVAARHQSPTCRAHRRAARCRPDVLPDRAKYATARRSWSLAIMRAVRHGPLGTRQRRTPTTRRKHWTASSTCSSARPAHAGVPGPCSSQYLRAILAQRLVPGKNKRRCRGRRASW